MTATNFEPPARTDIEAAAARIAGHARVTPIVELEAGALGPHPLTLKLDLLQPSGSFKARGACNFVAAADMPAAGVVGASGGNFGLALAWAAARFGHPATIFVTESTSPVKVERVRASGAEVVVTGAHYAEALAASIDHAAATGGRLAHAYDHPDVVAGAGTCARELADAMPDVDTIVVSVGGGGLIGGISSWFRGDVRVVGVESERTPTLHAALVAGGPVDVEVGGLAVDSLGARRLGDIGYAAAARWVDRSLLVPDEAIAAAQRALWDATRVAAEPGGATALAAILSGAYRPASGERVAVLICGGNVDLATITA